MNLKHVLGIAVAAVMLAGGLSSAEAAGKVTLRFANTTNKSSIDAAQVFVDVAKKESNGRLEIQHFPNNTLGDDRAATESMMLGDIAIVQTMPSIIAGMIPDLYVWDAPFLFNTIDDAWKCIDGPLGHAINEQVEKKGIKYVASVENGYRHYTNSKVPVRVPADVAGQKLRVMETDLQIAMWKNWGANPTPMAFAEVISGLQQGTIDAQENPLSIIDSNKLYEVQHYITLTGHIFSPHVVYINKEIYDSFDPEIKTAFDKAAKAYETAQRKHATELNELSVGNFKKAGCEVIELTDEERAQWRETAIKGGIYDMIKSKMEHPEYLDKILNHEY